MSSDSFPDGTVLAYSTISGDNGGLIIIPILATSTSSRKSTSLPPPSSSFPTFTIPTSTLPASHIPISSTIHPTSPTPLPSGPSASAKIGIGLGVPLGVIVLVLFAFLGYLYGKRRGNKVKALPAADEHFRGFPGDKDPSATQGQDGAGVVGTREPDDDGGLPRYAEELQGSPGVKRHELPAQHEATGYFSPDVIARQPLLIVKSFPDVMKLRSPIRPVECIVSARGLL